jgi:hypothetical protein
MIGAGGQVFWLIGFPARDSFFEIRFVESYHGSTAGDSSNSNGITRPFRIPSGVAFTKILEPFAESWP